MISDRCERAEDDWMEIKASPVPLDIIALATRQPEQLVMRKGGKYKTGGRTKENVRERKLED